jgi:hypothetical protein
MAPVGAINGDEMIGPEVGIFHASSPCWALAMALCLKVKNNKMSNAYFIEFMFAGSGWN